MAVNHSSKRLHDITGASSLRRGSHFFVSLTSKVPGGTTTPSPQTPRTAAPYSTAAPITQRVRATGPSAAFVKTRQLLFQHCLGRQPLVASDSKFLLRQPASFRRVLRKGAHTTIEIGFGRPWWITRRSIVAGWALHSRGWPSWEGRDNLSPPLCKTSSMRSGTRARAGHWTLRNAWRSPYVRVQIAWWGVVINTTRCFRFYRRDEPRFRMLVGFVCEEKLDQ